MTSLPAITPIATPISPIDMNRRFGETYVFHLQEQRISLASRQHAQQNTLFS
jgi:hypothetical protein